MAKISAVRNADSPQNPVNLEPVGHRRTSPGAHRARSEARSRFSGAPPALSGAGRRTLQLPRSICPGITDLQSSGLSVHSNQSWSRRRLYERAATITASGRSSAPEARAPGKCSAHRSALGLRAGTARPSQTTTPSEVTARTLPRGLQARHPPLGAQQGGKDKNGS